MRIKQYFGVVNRGLTCVGDGSEAIFFATAFDSFIGR